MRNLRSSLWFAALAALLLAPTGARRVAALPEQGTLERAGELSAPAHRAPEAPRLLGDHERGQGNGRNDHSPTAFLADAPWAVAETAPQFPAPFAARDVVVASARRGAPRYPTGPPDIVS